MTDAFMDRSHLHSEGQRSDHTVCPLLWQSQLPQCQFKGFARLETEIIKMLKTHIIHL